MIKVVNIYKSFGAQEIFLDVSFNISKKERVGLVGRNGHGKTTLLRMMIGEEQPDSGRIDLPKDYSLGYVKQHIGFSFPTVAEEATSGLPPHQQGDIWRAEKLLAGLGFSPEDMKTPPENFSGGYQVRLNLAKALASDPDLLLLDEPTNYLDIVSIRWLSSFLRQWDKELLLITHDRSFMDSVVTHILGIHRKKIKKISGTTDKYYEQILKEEEIYEQTRLNDEKKRKETEIFINRFRAKARLAGLVQSRIKAMEKAGNRDKLEKIKTLDFNFAYRPTQAKYLMHVKELGFGYDKPLFKGLTFSLSGTDRLCIIGKNGKGKTTLLKLLAGQLKGEGEIVFHPSAVIGYYAQTNSIALNPALTVEEEIMSSGCDRQQARNICGAMMFGGDDALKPVRVISGGEKARVLLGKIIAAKSNLLLLDEPTNHLDMESCDAFLAAIDEFPGAVVLVTHNEMFLQALANRFVVFGKHGAELYEGSYRHFIDTVGWDDEWENGDKNKNEVKPSAEGANKKDLRKKRADIMSRRTRALSPLEGKSGFLEKAIEELENRQKELNEKLIAAAVGGNSSLISSLSVELHAAKKESEALYDELSEVSELLDKKKAEFEAELEALK